MKHNMIPDEFEDIILTPEERKAIYKASAVMLLILTIGGIIILNMLQ